MSDEFSGKQLRRIYGGSLHPRRWWNREFAYRGLTILSPLLALVIWEAVVRAGVLDGRFFPPPSQISRVLWQMATSGELARHIGASLSRVVWGFLIGAGPGIAIGLLIGRYRGLRAVIDPLVAATYPIPKIALLPLLLVIFGLGEASKVAMVAVTGFYLTLITTAQGVMRIEPVLLLAGRNYGAEGWALFVHVILPASLPAIFTGLRLALGNSLLIIIAAEFVAADQGLGYLIWISWSTMATGRMYAGLVVIAVLGLLFTNGLDWVGRRLMPWLQIS
ncbi:MAG: ABC transporter permease [Chloroflexi bacterium]|nr:ABC transporter permease [Chloroflexota bacterium]